MLSLALLLYKFRFMLWISLNPLESEKKCHKYGVSLCPGFVQLVVQRMGFGHCSRLKLLAI